MSHITDIYNITILILQYYNINIHILQYNRPIIGGDRLVFFQYWGGHVPLKVYGGYAHGSEYAHSN